MKKKKCADVGIRSFDKEFSEDVSEKQLLQAIHDLNINQEIDGILVQLPLPPHINSSKIIEAIRPDKDIDGFHPLNMGNLLIGEHNCFCPCTPLGIHVMLNHCNIPIEGKHVVIVGRSNIVGKPLAALLMQKSAHCNATVTVVHSKSNNLKEICRSADILVAAIGRANFITPDMVKKGCCVIDVGINRELDAQGKTKIVGDVDFSAVAPLTEYITPVPGGVGPMTIAMLLSNTLLSYQRKPQKG